MDSTRKLWIGLGILLAVSFTIWMRIPGDTIFSIGAITLTWFVVRVWIGPRRDQALPVGVEAADR